MINKLKRKNVFIVSDATGETATHVLNAAMRQYSKKLIKTKTFRKVNSPDEITKIVDMAYKRNALIFFTFVYEQNRALMTNLARQNHVLCVDILGEPIHALAEYLGVHPMLETTLGNRVTDDYMSRVDALEFFLAHDDGVRPEDATQADVVLIGVSRSGKSPLSLYLAQKGYKVINIPYVKDIPMPDIIDQIDKRKIIGLLIRAERLHDIRKRRLKQYKYHKSDYADIAHIQEELEELRRFFRKHRIRKIIDITSKAIEEAAAEIIEYLERVFGVDEENNHQESTE